MKTQAESIFDVSSLTSQIVHTEVKDPESVGTYPNICPKEQNFSVFKTPIHFSRYFTALGWKELYKQTNKKVYVIKSTREKNSFTQVWEIIRDSINVRKILKEVLAYVSQEDTGIQVYMLVNSKSMIKQRNIHFTMSLDDQKMMEICYHYSDRT